MATPSVLFMGSYPPRECGIATFTYDLVSEYDRRARTQSEVVAIDEAGGEARRYPARVIGRLAAEDRSAYVATAHAINASDSDVLCVQHEYGLFGGPEGSWFLDLLDAVTKPICVALHTVLPEPSMEHRSAARRICARADAIVVLSQTGKDILVREYGVDAAKVSVIHHGVPDVPFGNADRFKRELGLSGLKVISTFGLLGRGKGLEFAIDAMRGVVERHPDARYLILGQTHPTIRRNEGEAYRESLAARVAELGLRDNVVFVDRYLSFAELITYLRATDVYLTPYLNPAQIVSGTLAYAVGCGKAIVSTPYLYARELLADGRGTIAEFRNSASLTAGLLGYLDDPARRHATERRAYAFGRAMTWPNVADDYRELFSALSRRAPLDGLRQPA